MSKGLMRTMARWGVRSILMRGKGPHSIVAGRCRGLKMHGATASYLLSLAEPELRWAIRKYVNRGDVVLDIGANVGFFTMYAAIGVGSEGCVLAFEPVPPTFSVLEANVKDNGLNNVIALNVAVSDKEGKAIIRVPRQAHSMASLYWHKGDADSVEYEIRTRPLDSLSELAGRPVGFAKVDVEGAEGDVLSGMRGLLSRDRPVVFLECSDIGRRVSWDVLKAEGYRCFDAATPAFEIVDFTSFRHSNFLWIPDRGK